MRPLPVLPAIALLGVLCAPVSAQTQVANPPTARVTQAIDESKIAALQGQLHPLLKHAVDQGPVEEGLELRRMTLMLKRSNAQQAELDKLVEEQQDVTSAEYHRWLTPQSFGERFGPAAADMDRVTGWLRGQGFTVERVAAGRQFIEFSGTAAQVGRAFHTSIHHYTVNGEAHIANAQTLSVPAALAPVVAGVRSLHDFRKQTMHHGVAAGTVPARNADGSQPAVTFTSGTHAIAPSDFAAIYNSQPLINGTVTGGGAAIAILGRSNFRTGIVTQFYNLFLPYTPTLNVVLNGPDPGILEAVGRPCVGLNPSCPERDEAMLDVEWSGAVAPQATVNFVLSQSTATADGVDLSEQYAIDNNLGDVISESFGTCEGQATQADADAVSALAQQAAAQGMTYTVSSGDSGADTCAQGTVASGTDAQPSVNLLASSPYTIAVGGTEFNEACTIGADGFTLTCAKDTQYWNLIADPNNPKAPYETAKGYIPERVWNEACPAATTGSVTGCLGRANLYAGGGGASQFVPKPAWQKLGVPGMPADDHRYVPDVSLTAAAHDFYLVCTDDADCVRDSSGNFHVHGIAGTSASAPSFAGIMALVLTSTAQRQGDAQKVLYRLAAAQTYANCNGSSTDAPPASDCIFNDTTVGDNAVPGEAGYGTASASYQAGVGYDPATGLGSVNVANLVARWASGVETMASATALSSPAPTVGPGGVPQIQVTVNGSGTFLPIGTVTIDPNTGYFSPITVNVVNGTTAPTPLALPPGIYDVAASYSGDSNYSPSVSAPITVTVEPPGDSLLTRTTMTPSTATANEGDPVTFNVLVTSPAGIPSGLVDLWEVNRGVQVATLTLDATGAASFTSTKLLPGPGQFRAMYEFKDKFLGSTSHLVSVTVIPSSYTLAATPGTINLAKEGANASATLAVAPTGAFAGTVALSCTMTPAAAVMPGCNLSASSVTLGGAANVTVNFTSIAPTARPAEQRSSTAWAAGSGVAFAAMFFFLAGPRRRRWLTMLGVLCLVSLAGGTGCGGSSGSSGTAAPPPAPPVSHAPGTTPGTYTATLTGTSGTQSVATTITLVVP